LGINLSAIERACRTILAGAGLYVRPDFLIIGAQKAGTTALHHYLSGHPRLVPAGMKEVGYFSPDVFSRWTAHPHYDQMLKLAENWDDPATLRRGRRWYHAQFPMYRARRGKLFFEATPEYLPIPDSPGRIFAYRPDMKLIVLLRDPVARAYSAWNMFRNFSGEIYEDLREKRSFEAAVGEELERLASTPVGNGTAYLRRGLYHRHLQRYLDIFPRDSLLILEHRAFEEDIAGTLDKTCQFIGVEPFENDRQWAPEFVGNYESGLTPQTYTMLADFFAPHNEELFTLIGERFDHWGVR